MSLRALQARLIEQRNTVLGELAELYPSHTSNKHPSRPGRRRRRGTSRPSLPTNTRMSRRELASIAPGAYNDVRSRHFNIPDQPRRSLSSGPKRNREEAGLPTAEVLLSTMPEVEHVRISYVFTRGSWGEHDTKHLRNFCRTKLLLTHLRPAHAETPTTR